MTRRALVCPLFGVPCQSCPHPHQVSLGASGRGAVKYSPGQSNPKVLLVIARKISGDAGLEAVTTDRKIWGSPSGGSDRESWCSPNFP